MFKLKRLLKKVKNIDQLDIMLTNLGMLFLTIFLLKVIPGFMDWAHRANIWIVLLTIVILFARPCYKYCKGQKPLA